MCGRFTLATNRALLARLLGVPESDFEEFSETVYRPRWNIAPTDEHWLLRLEREDRRVVPARWGLVNAWAKDASRAARQINARAEQADRTPVYREAFRARRCAIPADGFYEWTGAKNQRRPVHFHRPDGGLLLFAGLYEVWVPPDTPPRTTFTILTTDANADVQPIHDRMPVLLDDAAVDEWLWPGQRDVAALKALLRPPPPGTLEGQPASRRANSVKHDGADLLVPEPDLFNHTF